MTEETKQKLLSEFALFRGNGPGIESWISDTTPSAVLERLANIEAEPVSAAQLNQLLILSHEAGVSLDFFKYYWLSGSTLAKIHPYNVTRLPGYNPTYDDLEHISSLPHLTWGLYRLYVDALLYFGNIRQAYRVLRIKTFGELSEYFSAKRFDTSRLISRGGTLSMETIAKDDRYLIAEMACKTYDPDAPESLDVHLKEEFRRRKAAGANRISFRELIAPSRAQPNPRQVEMEFSINEVLGRVDSFEPEPCGCDA